MGDIKEMLDDKKKYRTGLIFGVAAMVMWGVLPLYWKALVPISSYTIVLYRIVFYGLTCFIAAVKVYGFSEIIAPLKERKTVIMFTIAGLLVTVNWNIYIYAVNSGQAIETSIGYYLQPLIVCVFGIILFKERPTKYRSISLVFASIGVLIVLIHFMRVPLIAIMLGVTFATYAAIKRHLKMKALVSIFCETIFITPFALALIIYSEINGNGALTSAQPFQWILLSLSGIVTALPLLLFAAATNRISMIPLGIIGYIAPSITLYIGIFVFNEPFDFVQFIAFVVIWIGLVFFTYGELRKST